MKFRKSQLAFYSCLSFIIGVGLASFVYFAWPVIFAIILAAIILFIFSRSKSLVLFFALCFLFFTLGISRYQLSIPVLKQNHIAYYNAQQIIFQGMVVSEPDARTDHFKLKVKSKKVKVGGSFKPVKGNVLVKANLYPQYNYGDVLEISCALSAPEPIEDFQYDKYLAKEGIYSVCYRGRLNLLARDQGGVFKSFIFKFKARATSLAGRILPEPHSSFLAGLLWGAKKGLPGEILDNFNRTGVTHIIAVSGYNITILAAALTALFISLGVSRTKVFWLIVLAVAFFIVITGFPASIIRAGIMGIIVLMSATLGRVNKMGNTLILTCLIMLLFNPQVLIWDAGFQLSFLATLGLIYLAPVLKKFLGWLPNILAIRESLTTTLSAILATTPLILWQFGRLAVIAPLVNLLVLPAIPVNMLLGFTALLGGLIWLPLGQFLGWGLWLSLSYVLQVTALLAGFSWSQVKL